MRKQNTGEQEMWIKFLGSIFVNLDGALDNQNLCAVLCASLKEVFLTAILCDTGFSL